MLNFLTTNAVWLIKGISWLDYSNPIIILTSENISGQVGNKPLMRLSSSALQKEIFTGLG